MTAVTNTVKYRLLGTEPRHTDVMYLVFLDTQPDIQLPVSSIAFHE